jgi:hypothetical protein
MSSQEKKVKYVLLKDNGGEGWVVERFYSLEELEKELKAPLYGQFEIYEVVEQKLSVRSKEVKSP